MKFVPDDIITLFKQTAKDFFKVKIKMFMKKLIKLDFKFSNHFLWFYKDERKTFVYLSSLYQ